MDLTLILWIGGGLVVILLVVGVIITIRNQRSVEEERIGEYVEPETKIEDKKVEAATPITDWLTKRVEKSSYGDKIARDLARADLKIKPGEYIAAMIIAAFLTAAIGFYIGKSSILLLFVGAVFGAFLPSMYVKGQQKKRLIRFNDQLADMLSLMVNCIRAGLSTIQAMESVSKELPPPISDEFRRVVQEIQLGVPIERALENLLRRIPSDDLDLVLTAINVQREVGGNLAEILDTISHTIRERVKLKGEIRVLTSQMSYSGKFLSLMPIIVVLVLYVMNRDYVSFFFKPESNTPFPCGYLGLGVAGFLIIIGYFVMTRMGKVEV
jgi:tight adherence protein B